MLLILRQVKNEEILCKGSITRFFWFIVILVIHVHLSVNRKVKNKTKLSSSQLFWLCDFYSKCHQNIQQKKKASKGGAGG